jgi:hypothetical protein
MERYPEKLFSWQVRNNGLIRRRFSRDRIRAFRGEDVKSRCRRRDEEASEDFRVGDTENIRVSVTLLWSAMSV